MMSSKYEKCKVTQKIFLELSPNEFLGKVLVS